MKKELYLGLDVHKDCIITAVAEEGAREKCAKAERSAMICTRWKSGLDAFARGMERERSCERAMKRGRADLVWRDACANSGWNVRWWRLRSPRRARAIGSKPTNAMRASWRDCCEPVNSPRCTFPMHATKRSGICVGPGAMRWMI